MAEVILSHIYKRYQGNVVAVTDFNLDIADKEFIVLVGPSGCGKSTTLRMIAGLEEISDGELTIDGKKMNDVAPKDRDIAMVFQNYALYPHMSVYQNMAFGLKLRHFPKPEIDKRVREAAQILDIAHLLDRKPKALSGGQRQRVALGRAIVREPKAFLMDEPLSNLDAKLRVQMRSEISKLHKRLQTTFIYVTHDQTEAMTMGDRIVVMKDGFIQQVATPQEIYSHPRNLFVAGFIGSPSMNFISGRIEQEGDTIRFVAPGISLVIPQGKHDRIRNEGMIGKEVVFGIRPEHVHDEPMYIETFPGGIFEATVDVVEHMGSEMYLLFDISGQMVNARIVARGDVQVGTQMKMAIDMDKIHLFDKESELAIF
ncbi:MAG: sn-glycerol-3-phosphate ABC transporter ATP-binding protein UgpC [Acidibacillus sp.]|uniref:Trehalose import ATP-binding protein SugC n=1 Tax=Sulfoacidibacillus ferrooxidans TaxID=2005001 RepID=A0A9X1V7R2_9BACL|nr:sn-glycerol-3-phosphate ABC transporter ATP-binding protein UgpC [Sulfoacidibacillus ferrooxidans]MCI0182732.1 Trehalose import ATP-binding protein SugC [Sulfoacidibacillus ferrooxidans]MCY0892521.1 sn-glycerol-3-phosphate ABC transporter ATP-binding protein UgpC [Acidibacillus sp.]